MAKAPSPKEVTVVVEEIPLPPAAVFENSAIESGADNVIITYSIAA